MPLPAVSKIRVQLFGEWIELDATCLTCKLGTDSNHMPFTDEAFSFQEGLNHYFHRTYAADKNRSWY